MPPGSPALPAPLGLLGPSPSWTEEDIVALTLRGEADGALTETPEHSLQLTLCAVAKCVTYSEFWVGYFFGFGVLLFCFVLAYFLFVKMKK